MSAEKLPQKNKIAWDQHGHVYELTESIGKGGQGEVWKTNHPNVLVKEALVVSEEKGIAWINKIRAIMRQPLGELPIAYPLALIVKPKPGYVMELMDGLDAMEKLIQKTQDAFTSENQLSGYLETGGLLRRLKLLARLARILAELHGRGLAYGDLSPSNVFVSKSLEYAEVWLIDADNITSQSRDSKQGVFTPDYGAPEILRGESGVNTLTDSWSFAVLAFYFLTQGHPLKGDSVLEGEPECEDAALRGELPWIDHLTDISNALTIGIPREITLNKPLRELFERCFNAGMNTPEERPSLSEWADAFDAATGHCDQCESCGNTFFYSSKNICSFCDHQQDSSGSLLFREYLYTAPEKIWDNLDHETKEVLGVGLNALEWNSNEIPEAVKKLIISQCWVNTKKVLVITTTPKNLYENSFNHFNHKTSLAVCTVKITDSGEPEINPLGLKPIFLTRGGGKLVELNNSFVFRKEKKTGKSGELHLGTSSEDKIVWRFNW